MKRRENGFILVVMLSLLLLLAVTATSLNFKSGIQARMAANLTVDVQTYFDQLAVIEQSLWTLAADPSWRVPAGENYAYHGRTYSRAVYGPDTATYPALVAYADAVIISVRAPNAARTVNISYRYAIDTPYMIRKPRHVYVDGTGNLFFADYDNHSVWRIDALTGAIVRIAGNGTSGFSGDGGPATEAQLDTPRGICTDPFGNIYIADTVNNRIRRVSAGFITTVAGTSGSGGYLGDGVLATATKLNSPFAVVTDGSGNLYIADTGNYRIRKVTVSSGIITTVAGLGTGTYSGAYAPLGDGGPATSAKLNSPCGLWVNSAGNTLFVSDRGNHRIRKVTSDGLIVTAAGTSEGFSGDGGAATAAQLNNPYAVWVDAAGNIFITDTDNHRIRKVTAADGRINTIVNSSGSAGYSGDGLAATNAQIDWPTGVTVKSSGEVIISDTNNSCLRQVDIMNNISTLPMTAGPGLNLPDGVASYYDTAQNRLFLYIADQDNHRIRRLDMVTNMIVTVAGRGSAGFSGDGGPATAAELNGPSGVAVDASGNIFVADTDNHRIRKFTVGGTISTVAGTGETGYNAEGTAIVKRVWSPEGVATDTAGNVYVADTNNHRIRKFTVGGDISTVAGMGIAGLSGDGGAATLAAINAPQGVWVDASGNIFIADTGNHRIRKITAATNIIDTVAGTTSGHSGDGGAATAAKLSGPQAVAVDGAGNIYIADTGNNRLRMVSHAAIPIITTLSGTAIAGYNGDNKPAVQARLSQPKGIALGLTKDGGRIYISDTSNNRIRMLSRKAEPQVYGP